MQNTRTILQVALPIPLRRHFDYLAPSGDKTLVIGARVLVPFGNRKLVGILIGISAHTDVPTNKLKPAQQILDDAPILPKQLMRLCCWASEYYQYALGEVFATALPSLLNQGKPAAAQPLRYWQLTELGKSISPASLIRAPKQQLLLEKFRENAGKIDEKTLKRIKITASSLKPLIAKQWLTESFVTKTTPQPNQAMETALTLNSQQASALQQISASLTRFQVFLLEGVTGSGKTEVYLQLIKALLKQGKRCLILVPEIGLTPQTVTRCQKRFSVPITFLHSGLNNRKRLDAWLAANSGEAQIIIGTRSAIFTPIPDLGAVIVDEEHDGSFKQQEGFRYSARDLAIVRAQQENIPIILGSATPSLESLQNAKQGRYQLLKLEQRAGTASLPSYHIIDIRNQKLSNGLSSQLLSAIQQQLDSGNQVLLFINRRGYAPVLLCHSCGWIADCQHCDAKLTLHQAPRYLQCHHCANTQSVPQRCPKCQNPELIALGLGTERLEESLGKHFPKTQILRIDRDTTKRQGSLEALLKKIHTNQPQILIGTQMLAKGHHFPHVTLVGILDADSGFFSTDFRACERLGQLITQVAGRAGRANKPGEVLIQTHHPEHPLLKTLITAGYPAFSELALSERQAAVLPPFSHLALFRSQATEQQQAIKLLEQIKQLAEELALSPINILGPIPAPMPKRAGHFRSQLLLQTQQRSKLQQLLTALLPKIELLKPGRVQWSLDIDPLETF